MRRIAAALLFLAAANASAAVDALLVKNNGDIERRAIGPITEAEAASIDHAWIWSDDSPPVRVAGDALRGDLKKLLVPATQITTLQFVPRKADVLVIAAPVAMWSEIPEGLLPTWPSPLHRNATPWRMRAIAKGVGSSWIELSAAAKRVVVPLTAASDLAMRVKPAAILRIIEPAHGIGDLHSIALFHAARDGTILIASAPPMSCTAIVDAPDDIPLVLAPAVVSELPSEVTLHRGSVITGRVVDNRAKPVANAAVHAEWWAARGVGSLMKRETRSDASGRFTLRGVAQSNVALAIVRNGFARLTRQLSITDERIDLNAIALAPAVTVQLIATDGRQPIAGAIASLPGSREEGPSDAHGIIDIHGVDAASPLRVTVRAPGFLRQTTEIRPPQTRVVMARSYRIRGRFLAEDGQPADGATVMIHRGNRETNADVSADGTFDLDLEPETAFSLVFLSPVSRELRVPIPAGHPGDLRDLGDLRAQTGTVIRGRIVADDLQPIAGASIWTTRSGQALLAYARGNVVRTQSDADGQFAVRGIDDAGALLRIDAPEFARAYRSAPASENADVDLGDIVVARGATVSVKVDDRTLDAIARLDLRGDGFDGDVLSAAVHGGEASIAHVPPGQATVTVERRDEVVCQQKLDVAASDTKLDVRCAVDPLTVRGRVLVDGRPSSGMIRWERENAGGDAVILTTMSPAGAPQQRVIGGATTTVTAFVADGRFISNELRAGRWRVTWLPDSGGSAGARDVTLAEAKEQDVTLEYGGASIHGVVVDRDDAPVPRAFVSVAGTTQGTSAGTDGSFELAGLASGEYRIRARERNRLSEVVAVRVDPGRESPALRLRVDRPATADSSITIKRRDGAPASGAVVVVETDRGSALTVTADIDGVAHAAVPADAQLRVAALYGGAFAFGDWSSASDRVLRFADAAAMTIVSERPTSPSIVSSSGWDVSSIIARFAARPVAAKDRPLELRGLPAGSYVVSDQQSRHVVTLRAGDTATVTLR
jgi:hypothetical protein